MIVLLRPLFLLSVLLFAAHQVLQWGLRIHLPWADAYLDNLLVMPVVLHLWLAEARLLFKRGAAYELSNAQIIAATVYFLGITELLFPLLSKRFTSDVWDIAYIAAGAVLYALVSRRYKQKQPTVA